jgi:hypothetical protein
MVFGMTTHLKVTNSLVKNTLFIFKRRNTNRIKCSQTSGMYEQN